MAERKRKPPFRKGQTVVREDGKRFRVTRDYVPETRPDYFDLECFELLALDPHKPFRQARGMHETYEVEEPDG